MSYEDFARVQAEEPILLWNVTFRGNSVPHLHESICPGRHFNLWRWGHYTVSKHRDQILQRRRVKSLNGSQQKFSENIVTVNNKTKAYNIPTVVWMNMQLLAPESIAWNRRMLGSLFLSALSESNSLLNAVSISSSDSFWGGPWPAEADAAATAYESLWCVISKTEIVTYMQYWLVPSCLPN